MGGTRATAFPRMVRNGIDDIGAPPKWYRPLSRLNQPGTRRNRVGDRSQPVHNDLGIRERVLHRTFAARGLKEGAVVEARAIRGWQKEDVMENLVPQFEVRAECARPRRPGDASLRQWVKTEHYRLHCVEGWPDSPYKEAVLAASRSVLQSLEADIEPLDSLVCMVCAARRNQTRNVLMFRPRPKASPVIMKPAA